MYEKLSERAKDRLSSANNEEKLAVTVWNYKGGVGKTTISLILAEIAAREGRKVLALDLDEQQNLAGMLRLTGDTFPSIEVRNELHDDYAQEDFDFFVLDTHPAQNDTVLRALQFADIVLIPILCDYPSVMNLADVFQFAYSAGVGNEQAALVKNCMSELRVISDIESVIDTHKYPIAGRLPRYNLLLRNLASGFRWDKGLQVSQREPFYRLYKNLWNAYRDMQAGKFHSIW